MSDSYEKHLVLASKAFWNASAGRRSPVTYPVGALSSRHHNDKEDVMGKYFLGWLLGVPAIVLVLIYFFMN